MVEADLFHCHYIVSELVPSLVDHSIGALTDFADLLVALCLLFQHYRYEL